MGFIRQKGVRLARLVPWLVLLISWYCMIFYLSGQDGTASGGLSTRLARLFVPESWHGFSAFEHLLRKTAHATEYAVLYLLWYAALATAAPRAPSWLLLALPLLLAFLTGCADEAYQRLSPGRACAFTDVLIDTAGAGAAGALTVLVRRAMQKRGGRAPR